MTLSRSSLDPPLRQQDADVYHSAPLRMVVEKPSMLSEVTMHLSLMVDMLSGGKHGRALPLWYQKGYFEVNRVIFLDTINFSP